jgi:integrase
LDVLDDCNYVSKHMAAIIKRGKTWSAVFRDSQRKQVWKVLPGITNKKEAQRLADVMEEAAQRRKNVSRIKRAFGEILKGAFGESGVMAASLREFVTTWLSEQKRQVSPGTFELYRKTAEVLLNYLGSRADQDISEITKRELSGFREFLATAGKAPQTINRYLAQIKMVFKHAHRDGYVLENPAEFVEGVRTASDSSRRPFTISELQAILSVADHEWASLIRFGLYTGQRLGDLARLTWANIDPVRGEIRLTAKKTGKSMTIPISDSLSSHIDQLPSCDVANAPIHPRSASIVAKSGKVAVLSHQFSDLLASAGIDKAGLSFHSLRHTAVSLLKDAGVPQAVVEEIVGHSSAAMSAHYTHVGVEALRSAASKLPSL